MLCNIRILLLSSVLILCSFFSSAQELSHVPGQFIVQLKHNEVGEQWIRGFNLKHQVNLYELDRLVPAMEIYTLRFDINKHDEQELLYTLSMDRGVEFAQYNHYITQRSTTPNDPEFKNQWQYINNGDNDGKVGADLDIDLAWDYGTGGVTVEGDTIVVCVVDDGIAQHKDIQPNLFYNYGEIPNNGIDDDNNGYVDDYRGWNTSTGSDKIDGGGHGTPVAGIIGAKGNDGFGVSGVNWDVKLMIVKGGGSQESEVIRAYGYPLSFRKRYNETNGAEGAFVVSTNSSWGKDYGQPADAPIWCAFYDTMGVAGIINCGATINADVNVDEQGDLPTGCTSDYLISVTNMNNRDEKVKSAGYGLQSIDLGAFGQGTWTTNVNGGFSGFGGTSGATPHVSGAIALLYSMDCGSLIQTAKSDPAFAAQMVKEAIMKGVDDNESLKDITVTGGRMNIFKSAEYLLFEMCESCPSPRIDSSILTMDNTYEISYSIPDTIKQVDLRWKLKDGDSTTWIVRENITSPFTFEDLDFCTDYIYQIKSLCDTAASDYGRAYTFTSAGCCPIPTNLNYERNQSAEHIISWDSIAGQATYNIRYKLKTDTTWLFLDQVNVPASLDSLENCMRYEYQVQSTCPYDTSVYSPSYEFFTGMCDNSCIDIPYCSAKGMNAQTEHIAYVAFGDIENSNDNTDGYLNYVIGGHSTTLQRSASYDFELKIGYAGTVYNENVLAWLDFNQNGVFEDTEIIVSASDVKDKLTKQVNIPSNALLGSTRMRVAMRYQQQPEICVDSTKTAYGQVHDYCVEIVPYECTDISTIDSIRTDVVGTTIYWKNNVHATYGYRYKREEDNTWITAYTTQDSLFLGSLDTCANYTFELQTICAMDTLDFGQTTSFKSSCPTSTVSIGEYKLSLYPNPFTNELRIQTRSVALNGQVISYQIYNQLGQRVSAGSTDTNRIPELSNLQAGMYWVQLKSKGRDLGIHRMIKL